MSQSPIDPDKLRAAIRKIGKEQVFCMLYEAIDLLPQGKLLRLAKRYIALSKLQPDGKVKENLLSEVKNFEKASLAGEYYESFDVNSKNSMEESSGTTGWIAECNRLLDRCIIDEKRGEPDEVGQAFDTIFGLLDHIDECCDDVIFFADEGGSWQVGVDWERVLPAWFKVLSATAGPDEYAGRITALLARHYCYGRDKMLAVARKCATQDQRKALAAQQRGETKE